jgi:uncharacterized membrane protein YqjE
MNESHRPLLADLQEQAASLAGDLRQMLELRWQLARLELEEAGRASRRLAVRAALAGVLGLTALPLVAVAAADGLDGWLGWGRAAWLAVFAATLLSLATVIALAAWRRFRREFTGMAETLEELREDAVWLREWTGKQNAK